MARRACLGPENGETYFNTKYAVHAIFFQSPFTLRLFLDSLQPFQRFLPVVCEQVNPVLDLLQCVAVHDEYSGVLKQLLHPRPEHLKRRLCAQRPNRYFVGVCQ